MSKINHCVQWSSHWTCSQCAKWICVSHLHNKIHTCKSIMNLSNVTDLPLPYHLVQNRTSVNQNQQLHSDSAFYWYFCSYMLYLPIHITTPTPQQLNFQKNGYTFFALCKIRATSIFQVMWIRREFSSSILVHTLLHKIRKSIHQQRATFIV